MKKLFFSIISLFFLLQASAQTKSATKKTPAKKAVVKKSNLKATKQSSTVELNNVGTNTAYGPVAPRQLRIADPTINLMNQRAAGANSTFRNSPVAGMPKGTYGIANGRILLRSTTATTSGTAYGSGAVGTGTSITSTGTSEATIGVNGKSPYAGSWLWGDRRPVYPVPLKDSARQQ